MLHISRFVFFFKFYSFFFLAHDDTSIGAFVCLTASIKCTTISLRAFQAQAQAQYFDVCLSKVSVIHMKISQYHFYFRNEPMQSKQSLHIACILNFRWLYWRRNHSDLSHYVIQLFDTSCPIMLTIVSGGAHPQTNISPEIRLYTSKDA